MADDGVAGAVKFRRVLLKLSGESLLGGKAYGIDAGAAAAMAGEVRAVAALGLQVCIVIGGGNIFRGMSAAAGGMDRVRADNIGMLATIMNAIALENALIAAGSPAVTYSAIPAPAVKAYRRDDAVRDVEAGNIVVFAGGTGSPFFTTDTTAALRAAETRCDVILKATQVDGIYTADPKRHPDATRFDRLSYDEALARNLQVMDAAAFAIARDARIPIMVFAGEANGSIVNALTGKARSTLVTAE